MATDTALFENVTGEVDPDDVGIGSLEVTSFDFPLGIRGQFIRDDDFLTVVRKMSDGSWSPEGDGNGKVKQIHKGDPTAVVYLPGEYSLMGNVNGSVTVYEVAE